MIMADRTLIRFAYRICSVCDPLLPKVGVLEIWLIFDPDWNFKWAQILHTRPRCLRGAWLEWKTGEFLLLEELAGIFKEAFVNLNQ